MKRKSKIYGNLTRVAPERKIANASISTTFRGNGKSALRVVVTTPQTGASPRQGWRLSASPADRSERGAVNGSNTAEFVAYNGPVSSTGRANPLTCTTAVKEYQRSVNADLAPVPFETRRDHANQGRTQHTVKVTRTSHRSPQATLDAIEAINATRTDERWTI